MIDDSAACVYCRLDRDKSLGNETMRRDLLKSCAAAIWLAAPIGSCYCKYAGQEGPRDPDPHYTIRAWRAVVTYLLRQQEFLYE